MRNIDKVDSDSVAGKLFLNMSDLYSFMTEVHACKGACCECEGNPVLYEMSHRSYACGRLYDLIEALETVENELKDIRKMYGLVEVK